jgi:hypothetical protein
MIALRGITVANIQIADFEHMGHALYIKRDLVSAESLLKVKEISEKHKSRVTSNDSYYIIR